MGISTFKKTNTSNISNNAITPEKADLSQVWAFTGIPSCTSDPSGSNDLVRKSYADGLGGGGGSPAGSDTHIQYNNSSSFGGSSNLTFDDTNNILKSENIQFKDIAAISNDTGSGEIVKFGTGTTTAGKLYFLHTDGVWTETDADVLTSGNDQLLGIAIGTNPATNGMIIKGYFDVHSFLDTFSAGKPCFISSTSGNITTTQPATGKLIRKIGYCTATSKVILFDPEKNSKDNVNVPYPTIYFDGSSTKSQIGNISLTGTITTDNGKYENGFVDFGTSGSTAPAVFSEAISLANGIYTFSFWFYSKRTGSDWGSILRQTGSGAKDYAIITRDSDDELGVYTASDTTFYSSGYDMTTHEGASSWLHMVVVANGTNSTFYISGSSVGTASAVVTTNCVQLGAYDGGTNQTFSEGIDEFAYWPFALTSEQVSKIYNSSTKLIDLVT